MTTTWLTYDQWTEEHDTHRERARGLTATFRAAQERGERHEIEEFLFSYYPIRPRRLERWSAGVGVGLWVPAGLGVVMRGLRWTGWLMGGGCVWWRAPMVWGLSLMWLRL